MNGPPSKKMVTLYVNHLANSSLRIKSRVQAWKVGERLSAEGHAMPRIPRSLQWSEEACFHLINRGHNRETIFADDADRRAFLELVARYRERFGFRLFHYCLMTNHFHLLVQLRDPREVSKLMAGILRAYVHHCHRRHGFVGHRWQGRFKSPAVQCREYLLSCGRYIERNPLDAGIVERPWDYEWSSARRWSSGVADPLVTESAEYLSLGSEPRERQEQWRRFVLGEDPLEKDVRREDWAIGDEEFRRAVALARGRPVGRKRGRPPKPSR
jgi:putative transposase